jgi:hypothetical protein
MSTDDNVRCGRANRQFFHLKSKETGWCLPSQPICTNGIKGVKADDCHELRGMKAWLEDEPDAKINWQSVIVMATILDTLFNFLGLILVCRWKPILCQDVS